MAKGVALTDEQITQRKREISATALELFRDIGFQKTSMREIAGSVSMGKSSLYDFFKTKDEIIVFIFEEEMLKIIKETEAIISLELPPEQCLEKLMECNLKFTRENNGIFLWVRSEERYLVDEYQKRLTKLRHDYQDMFKGVIEKGIAAGVFRDTDASLAARLLINSMLSIAYTTRPSGDADEMLAKALDIFFHGICV